MNDLHTSLNTTDQQLSEAERRLVEIRKQIQSLIREIVGEILEESRERLTCGLEDELEEQLCKRIENRMYQFLSQLSVTINVS